MNIEKIEFFNVSFGYEENNFVLQNFNAVFTCNSINFLVGNNGSGKTTLIGLLLNMWTEYSGKICFNNKEIRLFTRQELINIISVCFQNTPIFIDSIENNIILDYPNNRFELNKIIEEINLACDLNKKINGIETKLENDNTLSGGQKQKIGIARTIYTNKKIMIFDEPTSNLDSKSKKKFMQ